MEMAEDLRRCQSKLGTGEVQLPDKGRQMRRFVPMAFGVVCIRPMNLLVVCIAMVHGLQRDTRSPGLYGVLQYAELMQTAKFAAVLSCTF